MKKILCIIDGLALGGAERQMIGLVHSLKQNGYEINLVVYHQVNFYQALLDRMNIQVIRLEVGNSRWSKLSAVRRHIKDHNGYDCVIAYKDGPASICCMLKMLGGKFKLIVSERNTTQCITKSEKVKFWLYRFADYVVPNSYAQGNFIKRNFPSLAKKTVTITNFTDTDYFTPVNKLSSGGLAIMTAARITKQKNILNYLEAIKILKDKGYQGKVHFLWYGDVYKGGEEYRDKCLAKRQELGINDMIDFYPATSEILRCYQDCDVFCLPSCYEGYPNVICEAMSCGKPILCSNICDNPKIVVDGINGILFDPTDVNRMAETFINVIEFSNEKRVNMGMQNRETALGQFSETAFAEKYIEIIES